MSTSFQRSARANTLSLFEAIFYNKKKKKIIILGKFRYIANKKNMEHKLVWQWKKHIHQLKDYDEYITTLIQQSETLQKFGI